jgi:DNA processing protein
MMEKKAYFWFRLFRTNGIGPKALAGVQRELERESLDPGSVPLNRRILEEQYPRLARIIIGKVKADDQYAIRREYEALEAENVSFIYPRHEWCPPTLMADAEQFGVSPVLLCKGQTRLLMSPGVAIVGSRNVSEAGVKAARQIASDLAHSGFNVVSGYAKGVDTEAHRGALEADGTTTMVLSYGILEYRPRRDLDMTRFEQDCVAVSQFAPNEGWKARNAMARNKLVCALSQAVVVIESGPAKDSKGKMSGTFDAGRSAMNMGRLLFVVNPKVFDSPPAGNADLIQLGGISIEPSKVHMITDRLKKADDHWRYDDSQGRLAVQGRLFDPPPRRAAIE